MLSKYLEVIAQRQEANKELICCARQITRYVAPVSVKDRAIVVLNMFLSDSGLFCLPVLRRGKLCGLLNRHRFMEEHMIGKFGIGHSLNYYKTVETLHDDTFLQVDAETSIEQIAAKVHARDRLRMYDDIIITGENGYLGVVSVIDLLNAVMQNNLTLAIGANPLSGLPGNNFIERRVNGLLGEKVPFDICYIDIDSFKPYNDKYGFAQGDIVIKSVADLLIEALTRHTTDSRWLAGHIGGDDFILVTEPELSIPICRNVIKRFEEKQFEFHGEEVYKLGYYESSNRKGELERFSFLSLSVAVIGAEFNNYSTYAEISSAASGLKKKAKQSPGSIILRDQRRY